MGVTISAMTDRFSRRYGYDNYDHEITVRDDAPGELRSVLVDMAYESGLRPSQLRNIVCRALRVAADLSNWSDYPNIDQEVRYELMDCEWFSVYDVIEEIYSGMRGGSAKDFEEKMNDYFRRRGIGWQLIDGTVEIRGPETFEVPVRGALDAIEEAEYLTAHSELSEALSDLSRRPRADVTGAIQHAMAALECVARDITGDSKSTLGRIVKDNPDLLPKPLDQAIEKAWGYASERGRHLRSGSPPSYEDAELIVSVAGAVCQYLVKKTE